MEVTIKFDVESLEEIQPFLARGGENVTRALQSENERLRNKITALEGAIGTSQTEEPNVGDRDAEGTAFDPALHTGTKTGKGAWRARRKAGESSPSVTAAHPATVPTAKGVSPEQFREACKFAVNKHPGGIEAGKKFVSGVLKEHGSDTIGGTPAEKFDKILAELKNLPAAEPSELDGL